MGAHTWIQNLAPQANSSVKLCDATWKNMKNFCAQNHLKKAAMTLIAQRMDDGAFEHLRQMFVALDVDGDGALTMEELKVGLNRLSSNEADAVRAVMQGVDVDCGGTINYTEFLAAAMDKQHYSQESACRAAFNAFDLDGSGTIDRKELEEVLKSSEFDGVMSASELQAVMNECDADGDGEITFEEFMQMMSRG